MMNKKLYLVLSFILVATLALAACAPKEEAAAAEETAAKTIKIGFTLPTLQFPFYVRMHDTFIAEAEARGWEVVYVDGNLDSLTQVNASLDLLTQDIDALVMATWWIDAMPDVLDTAEKSGIPVFFMDQSAAMVPAGSTFASASGTDNYDAGYVGGAWMAERLKAEDKASVNLVLVTMTSETAVKRCDGFVAGMADNGIEVNVLNEYLGDTRANGMRSMEDALVTYPEGGIDLVFGYSAQSSLGAYDAIVAANRSDIQVVGFDGEDDEIALIDAGTQYIGTVVQYPDQMAILTAQLVEKVLNGEAIEQSNPVAAGVYDGK
ncbi:MAG: substrate-binding domain-containing protein [Anaerolineaceae bacterium]